MKHLVTVDDFQECMNQVRDVRRRLVKAILYEDHIESNYMELLRNAEVLLSENLQSGHKRVFSLDKTSETPKLLFNVKDELRGIQQDVQLLLLVQNETKEEFVKALSLTVSMFHSISAALFYEEMRALLEMLGSFISSGLDILITDWDGTMKTYSCTYATCMQPAYSAIIIAKFATKFAKFAAILTAGPLRDPGILDLTAIPQCNAVTFGGSWGREWMLSEEKVIDESCFTPETREALQLLTVGIKSLLDEGAYHHFNFVGSGFQRKVDRITLGIQTVSEDISPEMSQNYVDAVTAQLHKIDPNEAFFVIHREPLDLEIILKSTDENGSSGSWNKATGVQFVMNYLKKDISSGNVLLCGDTESDLPMVEFSLQRNPSSYAVFVNPTPRLRQKLAALYVNNPEKYCCVSCPEVVHAAMATMLERA